MASICPSCMFLSRFQSRAPLKLNLQPWKTTTRSLSQVRRKTPSRMTLSPRVSQQSTPEVTPGGQKIKPRSAGPFGAMNMREANIRGQPERRSPSQEKRDRPWSRGERDERRGRPREDFKALKMQRALSPVSYSHRSAIKSRISEIETFNQFPFLPSVQDSITTQALKGLEDVTPTPVQRLAIPELLGASPPGRRKSRQNTAKDTNPTTTTKKMEQFLLAAETGSGKTLAYLLPTLDAIKRAEALDADITAHTQSLSPSPTSPSSNPNYLPPPPLTNQPHPTTGRPRAIILLPTAELVNQVGTVLKSLSHTIKLRTAPISSSVSARVIRNRLFSPSGIDVLVSTPHLLSSIASSDPNILSRVTHLIIDEADSLLDRSFAPTTTALIDRATPSLHQLILCSATIPRSLDSYLRQKFPGIRRLATPNLHAIPRRVQLGVVDVDRDPYHNNKSLACADTIFSIGKSAAEHAISHATGERDKDKIELKRILVFVNEREQAVELAAYLAKKGIDAHALTRDTPEQRQSELLGCFTEAGASVPLEMDDAEDRGGGRVNEEKEEEEKERGKASYVPPNRLPSTPPRRSLPNTKVLVTTDLGSRGIDTLAVRHVILYDVPHTSIDFIHRLGRTGRMGRRGRGVVLVGRGDRRDVVREVREGMFKGKALI